MQELGGSTARQPAQAGQWKCSIPWTSCSVYEWGLAGGQESCFLVSVSSNPLLSSSLHFFRNFHEIRDFLGPAIAAQGLTANRSSDGEKKILLYIVCFSYSLL